MPDMSAIAIAPSPAIHASVRPIGTGDPGWARSIRSTIASQPMANTASGTATNGSYVQPRAMFAAVVVILLAVLVPLVVYSKVGESLFPPTDVTVQGGQVRGLYNIVFGLAVAIFVAVEGLIIWSVIRYRRKPGDDELPPQTHGNNLAEITWTLIPTVIVLFLFVVSWQTLNSVEAVSPDPGLKVRAVAGQFQWSFDYLPTDATGDTKALFTVTAPVGPDGGLVLPAG